MQAINVKIYKEQRNWLDKEIDRGAIASYGHSMRFLIQYYRKTKRVVAVLKSENAVLRDRIKQSGGNDDL